MGDAPSAAQIRADKPASGIGPLGLARLASGVAPAWTGFLGGKAGADAASGCADQCAGHGQRTTLALESLFRSDILRMVMRCGLVDRIVLRAALAMRTVIACWLTLEQREAHRAGVPQGDVAS